MDSRRASGSNIADLTSLSMLAMLAAQMLGQGARQKAFRAQRRGYSAPVVAIDELGAIG